MTPGELRQIIREEVRTELAAVDKRVKALEKTTAPRASLSDATASTQESLVAVASHMNRAALEMDRMRAEVRAELGDFRKDIDALRTRDLVQVKESNGTMSLRPAAMVAVDEARSAGVDASIAATVAESSRKMLRGALAALVVLVPVLTEVARQIAKHLWGTP